MPKVLQPPDLLRRIAILEDRLARLERAGWERDELPLFPTSLHGLVYEDNTSFTTYWETIFIPRAGTLALAMVTIGDVVSAVNTGGEWQVKLNDTTVVGSGTVPATFTYSFPTLSVSLLPYLNAGSLKVQLQARRTSGATTGGKYGAGGSIGLAPTYARLL
ncbi:hypothetical protein ACIP6Q_39030 [Streptomyces bobili]|uniref:hypothetical protein n=1 Tax=Streptomyces bobili TaxID=67280 RepID=UPI0037FD1C13